MTFDVQGSISASFVIKAIETFITKINKPTVLILDNAKIVQAKIEQWQQKGLYLFYLPAYSPHLNRIERVWRHTKYLWLNPKDYENLETLKTALDKIWNSFGSSYQIKFSKIKFKINVSDCLSPQDAQIFKTIKVVYQQQKHHLENPKAKISDRIVSIYKPYIRPIVRGKENKPDYASQSSLASKYIRCK